MNDIEDIDKELLDDDDFFSEKVAEKIADAESKEVVDNLNPETGANNIEEEWEGMPETQTQKIEGAYQSIIIHIQTEEDVQKLAELLEQDISPKTKYLWFPYKPKEDVKSIIVENEE